MARLSILPSRNPPTIMAMLMPLLLGGYACSSLDHKPDPESLVQSTDCHFVNGHFRVRSGSDGNKLATRVFESNQPIVTLDVEKGGKQVAFRAGTVSGDVLERIVPDRFSCGKSVLTVLLEDEASSGGAVMHTESVKLELFALDADTLTLRFIDSQLTFVFLIPVFNESDEVFVLERIEAVER